MEDEPVSDEPELELDAEQLTAEEIEELFSKSTESFRCLADLLISHSSLLRQPLYHFPPLEDPGIDDAFNYIGKKVLCYSFVWASKKVFFKNPNQVPTTPE